MSEHKQRVVKGRGKNRLSYDLRGNVFPSHHRLTFILIGGQNEGPKTKCVWISVTFLINFIVTKTPLVIITKTLSRPSVIRHPILSSSDYSRTEVYSPTVLQSPFTDGTKDRNTSRGKEIVLVFNVSVPGLL